MYTRTTRQLSALFLAATLSVGATACGSGDAGSGAGDDTGSASVESTEQPTSGDVTVTDAWVREPAEGQTLAAGYGTITNGTDDTVTLVGASAPISGTFEIHESSMGDDGTMSMSEKEGGFEIPAGESFTLEPGGPHVMMLDIDPSDFAAPIELTFEFDATEVTASAEIRTIGDATDTSETDLHEMDTDEMDLDETDMGETDDS